MPPATTLVVLHKGAEFQHNHGAALVLSWDGLAYGGTFGVLLQALVTDLLLDSFTILAQVVFEGDDGRYVQATGAVVSFTDSLLAFEDGTTVDTEAIVSLAVL